MSLHAKIMIGGIACIVTPVVLLFLHKALFLQCGGDYQVFDFFFRYIDSVSGIVSAYAFFLIPIGIFALLYGYVVWRHAQGASNWKVFSQFVLILLLILLFISVSLVSLNTSRNRGPNAEVMSRMSVLRAQAEIYYDGQHNGYSGMCESNPEVSSLFEQIRSRSFKQGALCTEWNGDVNCVSESDAYAADVKLLASIRSKGPEYYCVDSTGFAGRVSKQIESTACPSAFKID